MIKKTNKFFTTALKNALRRLILQFRFSELSKKLFQELQKLNTNFPEIYRKMCRLIYVCLCFLKLFRKINTKHYIKSLPMMKISPFMDYGIDILDNTEPYIYYR